MMDTAVKNCQPICCRLSAIILEHTHTNEQINQEASSSIQTGQDAEEQLLLQHIIFNCFLLTNPEHVRIKEN